MRWFVEMPKVLDDVGEGMKELDEKSTNDGPAG
jgi:hypothetical protein